METFTLVRPEHLNHHGYLFGGQLLKWIDEFAWLAASRDLPNNIFITRAMEKIDFKHRIKNGSILRFDIKQKRMGFSSTTYEVLVHADEPGGGLREKLVFSNLVTFVAVDERGRKKQITVNSPSGLGF